MICECGYDFIKCVIVHTPDKASKRKSHRDAVAASRAKETPKQSVERKSNITNAMATSRAIMRLQNNHRSVKLWLLQELTSNHWSVQSKTNQI